MNNVNWLEVSSYHDELPPVVICEGVLDNPRGFDPYLQNVS